MGKTGRGLAFFMALIGFATLAWLGSAEDTPVEPVQEQVLMSHKSFVGLKPSEGRRRGGGEDGGGGGGGRAKRQATMSDLSADEIAAYLNKHRTLRSQTNPEAANMKYMIWDDDLATMAQQWSDTCIWDHGMPENISPFSSIGQNLYLSGGGSPTTRVNGNSVVQAWFNEDKYYTFDTRACQPGKVCGHYTQVVWDKSYAVGCAQAFCPTAEETTSTNVMIVTCNYGPAGNTARQPFTAGPACTRCASGVGLCQMNQCSQCSLGEDGCECKLQCLNCGTLDETACSCACPDGFMGIDCGERCQDLDDKCGKSPGWPSASLCETYDYVRNGCPAMCSLCVEEQEPGFTCDSPGGTTGPEPCPTLPCANGGSFDSASCKCMCTDEYQGRKCQHKRVEARNGVEVRMVADIADWDSIAPHLLELVAGFLTNFCNDRFELCCPDSGTKTTSDQLTFVDASHLLVGTGYPETDPETAGVFDVLLLAVPPEASELCQGGSIAPSSRRRRDISEMTRRLFKRATSDGAYLDQAVLLEALQENMGDLAADLQAATTVNVVVESVEAGQEEIQAPPTQVPVGGLSPGAIAAIVIVVIIVLAVVAVASFFVYKKSAGKTKVDPRKGSDEKRDDVNGKGSQGVE